MKILMSALLMVTTAFGASSSNEPIVSIDTLIKNADFGGASEKVVIAKRLRNEGLSQEAVKRQRGHHRQIANHYLEQAAHAGSIEALIILGDDAFSEKKYGQAIDHYKKALKKGAVDICEKLAEAYYQSALSMENDEGLDVYERDEFLKKASKYGHVKATYKIAKNQDDEDLLAIAAANGYPGALYTLACKELEDSFGLKVNIDSIDRYLRNSFSITGANSQDLHQVSLADLQATEAFQLLKRASDAGHDKARSLYCTLLVTHGENSDDVIMLPLTDIRGHMLMGWIHMGRYNSEKRDIDKAYAHFSQARILALEKATQAVLSNEPYVLRMMSIPSQYHRPNPRISQASQLHSNIMSLIDDPLLPQFGKLIAKILESTKEDVVFLDNAEESFGLKIVAFMKDFMLKAIAPGSAENSETEDSSEPYSI